MTHSLPDEGPRIAADTAVLVARLQAPEMHIEHRRLLRMATEDYGRVILALGCSAFPSKKNPLDFITRQRMVNEEFPTITVVPVHDRRDDLQWSQQLDTLVAGLAPHGTVVLLGGRDSFIPHYVTRRHPTVELEGRYIDSATMARKRAGTQPLPSRDFRAGVVYAYENAYPRVNPTVDIAMFNNQTTVRKPGESWTDQPDMIRSLLLVHKENEPGWRLPGGFVNARERPEAAAARELFEETGVTSGNGAGLSLLCALPIEDWRARGTETGVITLLYHGQTIEPVIPVAADDVARAHFFPVDALPDIVSEHAGLIALLAERSLL